MTQNLHKFEENSLIQISKKSDVVIKLEKNVEKTPKKIDPNHETKICQL